MLDQIAKRDASQPTRDRSAGSTFRNPLGRSSTGAADDTHELKAWKARIVFQGSNVRTKAGTSAADLFEEVSNAPASFAAARAALAVAALKVFSVTLRNAETAYLQALADTPTRTPTFVELPHEW